MFDTAFRHYEQLHTTATTSNPCNNNHPSFTGGGGGGTLLHLTMGLECVVAKDVAWWLWGFAPSYLMSPSFRLRAVPMVEKAAVVLMPKGCHCKPCMAFIRALHVLLGK